MSRSLISLIALAALLAAVTPASGYSANVSASGQVGEAGVRVVSSHCGGIAPAVTECTLLVDREAGLGLHIDAWGVTPVGPYTGTLSSRLDWPTGSWQVSCAFENGLAQGCETSGSRFAMPTQVTQTCSSFELGTTTPGGQGLWECDNTHT